MRSQYYWLYYSLHYCYFSYSLKTWILQFSSIKSSFFTNLSSLLPLLELSQKYINFITRSNYFYSVHRVKINKIIRYSVLSHQYNTNSGHPEYLCYLVSLTRNSSTRSSSLFTLNRPCINSRLKVTNSPLRHTAPALRNSLPPDLRHFFSQLL
jgi:hypothetical protein